MSKKDKLQARIIEFVNKVLAIAENEDKLDFINIEISNHNGNLQMDYTLRNREKAY